MVDIERMKEMMEEMSGEKKTTIANHYGVTDLKFERWIKEMMCDLIMSENFNDPLEKWFKKFSNEDKAKIMAWVNAVEKNRKLNMMGGLF